ncbi:MAG: FAD-dependent oxidoreductase [Acidimicrobiia bacterium]|nr:FAD-dependent oxidoreductase [Acidimicrobiia bacterium]
MRGSVVVVGAGVAGCTAARLLLDAGWSVRVVDKGRSVGGRLATRRIGSATLDHGAQFFTVRSAVFAAAVSGAEQAGIVDVWCRGFGAGPDGHPRYAARRGMNDLAKYLADGLDVSVDTRIGSVAPGPSGWELTHTNGQLRADAVVLTAPVPQSLALLDAGAAMLDGELRDRLAAITYHPTLALLVVLDGPSAVPAPGGVQLSDGPFGFVADNRIKGISGSTAVTLHAAHDLSRDRWDDDPDATLADLLGHARPWFGDAGVVDAQLKRWRYAQPRAPLDQEIEAATVNGAPVVFAGDAFAGAKIEGAFLSGRAAALHLGSP